MKDIYDVEQRFFIRGKTHDFQPTSVRYHLRALTEDEVMNMLHENEWYDSDYWDDYYGSEYDTFEENLTTPSGDEIIAFGYYGHD